MTNNQSITDPIYTCDTCTLPVVPTDHTVYQKDGLFFCSAGCVYTYYEGEPAAQVEDYEP